tara:strand:- start:10199 stop:10531 length:333 start_codon:yes stop_codon:yes gene_type:complete
MEHQDWRQYIVHCKTPEKKDKEKSVVVKKGNNVNIDHKMDDKIEKGELKHKKVDTDLRKEFQKWRQSKKYSQKDVAIKLSVTPQIISKFENGQLNHDPKVVSKIKRLMKR